MIGFTVGQEFLLSADLLKAFYASEEDHKSMKGWFDKDQDKSFRGHLYAIRSVSIPIHP